MRSGRPKVLHAVAGRSMLAHALAAVRSAGADHVAVVVGPGREDVAAAARREIPDAQIFVQKRTPRYRPRGSRRACGSIFGGGRPTT